MLGRPGSDLLSHALRRSTIGAKGFHGRVRDGIGWFTPAITTRSSKHGTEARPWAARLKQCLNYSIQGRSAVRPARGHSPIKDGPTGLGAARNGSPPRQSRGGGQADRAISTGQLHALLRFHIRPINVVVYHGSQAKPGFEVGFPLRCFQRLSLPHLATQRCGWRHNWYTRGVSIPVLSY